jgi:hypothetical protein
MASSRIALRSSQRKAFGHSTTQKLVPTSTNSLTRSNHIVGFCLLLRSLLVAHSLARSREQRPQRRQRKPPPPPPLVRVCLLRDREIVLCAVDVTQSTQNYITETFFVFYSLLPPTSCAYSRSLRWFVFRFAFVCRIARRP